MLNPQGCNFTKFTITISNNYFSTEFFIREFDVANLPLCSNWPTFPQVYMNGELVGGADIMLQMHQSGKHYESTTNVDTVAIIIR